MITHSISHYKMYSSPVLYLILLQSFFHLLFMKTLARAVIYHILEHTVSPLDLCLTLHFLLILAVWRGSEFANL